MSRLISSSLLSLLLLITMTWGGCVSCEQYFMWPAAKSCCAPDGHCKTKSPVHENSGRECNQISLDNQKTIDFHTVLPPVPVPAFNLPLHTVEPIKDWRDAAPVEPSPPDLQVLHSTFLI